MAVIQYIHFHLYEANWPNLKLKTWLKQLLSYFPSDTIESKPVRANDILLPLCFCPVWGSEAWIFPVYFFNTLPIRDHCSKAANNRCANKL